MKRIFIWVLSLVILLGLGSLSYGVWLGQSRAKGYARVAHGDSEARVEALLGKPAKMTGRPANMAWDTDASLHTNPGECVRENWYAPPLKICGEAWTVGFDSHGKVVSKYHFLSR